MKEVDIDMFEPLEPDEVVSVEEDICILLSHSTFKVSDLLRNLISLIQRNDYCKIQSSLGNFERKWLEAKVSWVNGGVDCQVLRYGAKGWQTGKVRISLEFCPDEPEVEETPASNQPETSEPESPLDDIRRMMTEDNT